MELSHKICAVDLGSWTSKISALSSNHRFQIVVNQANFRETPSVVSFTNAERLIGDQAVTKMKSNYKNTIRCPQRLIGMGKKAHLLDQEMKYSTLKYRVVDGIVVFQIEQGNEKVELSAEQVLAALMTKFRGILQLNGLKADFLFLSVQSYLNNGERKALKACAQAAGFTSVSLIEQWQAIASEYFFVRQKEIEAMSEEIVVIFVDLGYTNFTVHACTISKGKLSLLDQEYLRYTGSKNIDLLLVEFYIELVRKQTGKDVRENQKAMIKLLEAVEIQRKKLSANVENQLTIECLLGDYDLSYNMKRQQLENIAMPVISDFASAMQNLRSRVEPLAPIHSIEIIGGVSRMPFIQEVVRTVFNNEPSKKMNASESVSRGCCIAGASRLGLIKANMCNSIRNIKFPIFVLCHSIQSDGKVYGKQPHLYSKASRKNLFDRSSILPANTIVKIEGEGQNEVLICQQEHLQIVTIGYLSFKGSDNLTVLIDADGIMRARLMKNNVFDGYDFGDLVSVERAAKLKEVEEKMKKRDSNILQSYELRNQFQSLLYNTRESLNGKWKQYCPPEQAATILQIVQAGEHFLTETFEHSSQNFKQRIQTLNMFISIINTRRDNHSAIQTLRRTFTEHCQTVLKLHANDQKKNKVQEIEGCLVDLYNKEANAHWDGKFLNAQVMKDMIVSVDRLK